MNEWCTYETRFSNGFYYYGKGKTRAVNNGTYTGSGTRYRLALLHWENSLNSGEIIPVTTVLDTYATEVEAYSAEELLVPITLLSDPFCLNMHSGGLKGRYQTAGRLLTRINSEKRMAARKEKAARAKLRKERDAQKIRDLKNKLKEKK